MAMAQGPLLAAVLLLVSSGLHGSSPPPACPQSCTCQRAPLLNCSSSGLSLVPQHIQDSVTELDLSHNLLDSVTLDRPHRNLRNVWLGNNTITHLSLCIERNLGGRSVRGRQLPRLRPWSGCVSWAPDLQLLSVERNQLVQLPQGLEGSSSLLVLQLSFNRISTLRPGDLSPLRQLKELHLQHNLITSLHPQMFQDLAQLRVLDLSFNMLTSLHSLTYLSLRNIGADVRLGGNRWQCDCSMRSLRRQMVNDSSRGLKPWNMVCASPSILSGKDLLQLEEDDLNCFGTENRPALHRDVTVYSGSEIVLSCSTQDSTWWMPSGQASVSQPQAGLLISDVTERDTGLYVCTSENHEVVSVFNLQISRIGGARRKTRSLPRTSQQVIPQGIQHRIGQERNQRATQSDLALAVCLSVFITFLVAFILGVLARPCIDVLWTKAIKKKSPSATNSVSSVEQRQYENEAYSHGEEPEEVVTHRERRVTFSTIEFREDSDVQYYDTVANDDQGSINNDAVTECEAAKREKHTAGDSGSESSLQQDSPEDNARDGRDFSGVTDAGRTHKMEFEHIPDPVEVEERRSLSSCSDSSLSDRALTVTQGDHTIHKSPQLEEDPVQQRADFTTSKKVEVQQIYVEGRSEIPGFSSEPFADWSPHTNNTNPADSDLFQENEELFEFSDSVQSTSARSSIVFGSFNDSKLSVIPTTDKQSRDEMSSSSSCVSEGEPTQYTVNSDQEEEEAVERIHRKPEVTNTCLKQDVSLEQQIHGADPARPSVGFIQADYTYDTQRPAERPQYPLSSDSSDSDGEPVKQETRETKEKVKPMPRTKWRGLSLGVTSFGKSLNTRTTTAYSSTSSSENEAEITDLKVKHNKGRVCQIEKHLDIKAPLPASDSPSSDETTKKQGQREVNMAGLKRRLDIKAPSPPPASSSSSDSEDETTNHIKKHGQREVQNSKPQFQESQESNDPQTQWPALELEHTKRIKRRLDIKAPSLDSDLSSSSDSEDETTNSIKKQEQGEIHMAKLPNKVSQTVSHDPQTQWPALDLEHTTRIKRRLDIKAPSPPSDSSSSSDSEDETVGHAEKQMAGKVDISGPLLKDSQTASHDPGTRWPALDLEHIPHIKTRLDIKAPLLDSDSSSSSDSENETTHLTERPGKVTISRPLFKESQTASHDPDTRWPALDLEHIPHIKRRLDIKAPSPPPASSSSSDSEDGTTNSIKKQGQGEIHMAKLPNKVSQTVSHDPQTQWPVLDLEHTTRIKRRLDIKAPSLDSDSSSSSDSENETTHLTERPGKVTIAEPPLQQSQTASHDPDTRWPALDLEHIPHINRRLNIKVPSPPPASSSSSGSEDEKTNSIKKYEQGQIHMAKLPSKVSQTVSHDPQTQWPALDLEHTTRIKRRLDIKAPSPPSDSSSSSDSEDETVGHTEKQTARKVYISGPLLKDSQTASHDPDTRWPALDLEHIPHVKTRLDIKAPSLDSDSSSSSDSENETTHLTERPGKVAISRPLFKESQTASHDPDTRWPALDLEHIPHIKRRLDIKAPSPPPASSSSSGSEDEKTNSIKKQEQGEVHMAKLPNKVSQTVSHDPQTQWPALDLEHTTRIKKRLDIKAPSPPSDSSSSSDSEDETVGHTEKQTARKVYISGPLLKDSQTASHDPDTRWPALDLEHIPHIKTRLDIKAPSPPSDSSSSSDSEDGTTNSIKKQGQGEIHMAKLPNKVSQTVSHDPQTQWPVLDLGHTTRIKRRLDIKAPSLDSDSSSSSDSENETTHLTERPGKVTIAEPPLQQSQTASHDPDTRWPALDLEHIPHINRRLNIKAPSPPPASSSSSGSEDEKTNSVKKYEQGQIHMAKLPSKVSQTVSHDPQTQWPALDLEHTTRIKRRLDIKAPSPPSDSSSSSDSEDETVGHTEKQTARKVYISGPLLKESQTVSHDSDTRWPALDLEHIPHLKRRLDIKAPSLDSDSSSSSDSEDETTNSIKKQEQGEVHMAKLPNKVSQTVSHGPQTQWPALDLEHTTRIKRRLDIKAPSPPSDSSSSSDSENETTHLTERPGKVAISRPVFKESQTASHDPDTRWPALDTEHFPYIKRRLDIKAPSLPPASSSSSDSEDEPTNSIKKQEQGEVHMAKLPNKVSQTVSHGPQTQWPALDLEHTTRIKRRLDIKAPSPPSDSSSSSDSENETTHLTERPGKVAISRPVFKESQTASHDPDTRWPALDTEHFPYIKRRLDIKAPSPPPASSSSSDSEDETTNSIKKQEQGEVHMAKLPNKVSQTVSHGPQTQWPALDLEHTTRIKRRLDIKAPSPPSDSSSSSDSEDETANRTVRQSPDKVHITELQKSQAISHDPDAKWHALDLEHTTRIKRRLDIKAPSPQPDLVFVGSRQSGSNSSTSESDDENRDHNAKVGIASEKEFIRSQKIPVINMSHNPKTDHQVKLEKYTVVANDLRDKPTNDSISTTPEINPELQSRWATMNLGISRFRKRLEITSPSPDSASSSSSDRVTGDKSSRTRLNRREHLPVVTDKEAPHNHTSVYVAHAVDVKLHESQSKTEEVESKAGLQRKSQMSKMGEDSDSMWSHPSFTNIPHVKRALDIRPPLQRESPSSSNSEDETVDHSVPDLSLGVPRIKRRLNIKAPSPEPNKSSSSCSENENEVTGYSTEQSRRATNMSGMTDYDSQITYKRSIIKASLPFSNSFSSGGKSQTLDHETVAQEGPSHNVSGRNTSLAPRRVFSLSFDDLIKKRTQWSRGTTDVDLPPEIRWTGVGRHLSDLSISSPRRHLDVGLLSGQQAPPAEPALTPPDSANSKSDDKIKQDREKADLTLMHKYSSISTKTFASSRALDGFDNSHGSTNESLRTVSMDRRERKGLSALKTMSSERQKWDTEDEVVEKGASSLFDHHGPQTVTSFNYRRFEEDLKPLATQPLLQLSSSSTSVDERTAADVLYDIPRYRRHDTGDIEPPQEAPPPIPATPPPDEAAELTWRSPQSIQTQGWEGSRSYLQQRRNTKESDPSSLTSQNLALYFDSSNLNISDV